MVKQREGLEESLETTPEINCLLRIIEACLGREMFMAKKSRNRYLKYVQSEMLMCVGSSVLEKYK